MIRYVVAYFACALVFLAMDAAWLSQMASRVYKPALGDMIIDGFRPAPAAAFYLIYMLGLVAMAVAPALAEGDWRRAAMSGAMYGFFAYATYDLTNLATLRHWSLTVSLLDMGWGAVVSGVSAAAGFAAASWIKAGSI